MKITRKQLTQIIKEEITAATNKVVGEGADVAAEGKYADTGRDMKRIKHTNPDSVAKELALLAKDLENMGYGQEAMSLRSWAEGWDLDHRYGREEGELEESFVDGDRRWDEMEKERIRKAQQAIADEREAKRKRAQGGGSGYDHGGVGRNKDNFREE